MANNQPEIDAAVGALLGVAAIDEMHGARAFFHVPAHRHVDAGPVADLFGYLGKPLPKFCRLDTRRSPAVFQVNPFDYSHHGDQDDGQDKRQETTVHDGRLTTDGWQERLCPIAQQGC